MGGMKKGASSTPFDQESEDGTSSDSPEDTSDEHQTTSVEADVSSSEMEDEESTSSDQANAVGQTGSPTEESDDTGSVKPRNPVSNDSNDDVNPVSDDVTTSSEDADDVDPAALAEQYIPDDYQHKGSNMDIKWALGRENVRKSRDKQKMFLLQNKIDELEEEVIDQLSADEEVSDVNTTDVREAALILAYNQPEKLAELLDGWGARHV